MRSTVKTCLLLLAVIFATPAFAAEIRPDRLWLSQSNANLRPLLMAAAQKALENPDCIDVLYGRLNEYRTENENTAFTILCMKDARTTFNQVIFASELLTEEIQAQIVNRDVSRAELERLRQMLQQPVTPDSPAAVQNGDAEEGLPQEPANTAPPVLF